MGLGVLLGTVVPAARASAPLPDPTVPAARETEPIVLQGSAFGAWAAPAEQTAKAPDPGGPQCIAGNEAECSHNQYEDPEVATGDALGQGVPIDKLLGYRWDDVNHKYVQIPFQVDEIATRYLSNNNSGFSAYSWSDQHPTYVYDQERFRWTAEDPSDPCHALPRDGINTSADPVPGLDTNDEVAFMASDAGNQAPAGTWLPKGITEMKKVVIADPTNPTKQRYAYVGLAAADGPKPAYNASNG